ncbi:hypothetical protein QBC40DRAFT_200700 [Triangularia verruculosa]|uniref:C2H2-type domain-containing protein n=1 Tax=Triangularia verruculosa TaxID=2587418 RepID=A0AAN6XHI1_9PEZI|nr:hypothetical protein QBC40DRAFT_200700 [Triangularia verruculosa]
MAGISHPKQPGGPDDSPVATVASTMTGTLSSPALSCHTTEAASSDSGRKNSLLTSGSFIETSKLARILKTTAAKGRQLFGGLRRLIAKHGGRVQKTGRIMAAMGGFIVACIALWSAFCAMEDSRKAVRLAEWTAKKDFLEFCQTTQYQETGCEDTKTKTLGPPPTVWIKARMYRPGIGENKFSRGPIVASLGFPFAAILWTMFRKRLRRVVRRQLPARFNITGRTQKPGQRATRRERVPPPITFGSGMGAAFNFDSPFPEGKLDFGHSTSLEHLSPEEMARRKKRRAAQSPAALAPVTFNLLQSKQPRHLRDCLVCSLKFKTTEELTDHSRTHVPVYCWQCDLRGINHDGKTVVTTAGSMSCLANPVFCHYCGDSFARWVREESESKEAEAVRLRKNTTGRYSTGFEVLQASRMLNEGAQDLKVITPLSRFRTSMPPRRPEDYDIVDGITMRM